MAFFDQSVFLPTFGKGCALLCRDRLLHRVEKKFFRTVIYLNLIELSLSSNVGFLLGHSRPLFHHFRLFFQFQCTIGKVCRCSDSNRGSLVSEATALPTEPPPLPQKHCYNSSINSLNFNQPNVAVAVLKIL